MSGASCRSPRIPVAGATSAVVSPTASTSCPGRDSGAIPDSRSAIPPAACTCVGWSGTTNSSRPRSSAHRAVIRDPDRTPASTTTTARDSPAMTRFRWGKVHFSGCCPGGSSETRSPPARKMARALPANDPTIGTSSPCPNTPIVRPCALSCAASSIPHATPLTTTPPAATTVWESSPAYRRATSEHRRAPTIAAHAP